jgi:hypothetical protein
MPIEGRVPAIVSHGVDFRQVDGAAHGLQGRDAGPHGSGGRAPIVC